MLMVTALSALQWQKTLNATMSSWPTLFLLPKNVGMKHISISILWQYNCTKYRSEISNMQCRFTNNLRMENFVNVHFFFITAYKETHHIRSYCALVSTFSVWSPLKEATLTCDTKVYNLLAESSSSLRIRAKRTRTLKGVPLKNENQFDYKHSIQRFQLKKITFVRNWMKMRSLSTWLCGKMNNLLSLT